MGGWDLGSVRFVCGLGCALGLVPDRHIRRIYTICDTRISMDPNNMHTYPPTHLVRERPRDDVAGGAEARQEENDQRVADQGHLFLIYGWLGDG